MARTVVPAVTADFHKVKVCLLPIPVILASKQSKAPISGKSTWPIDYLRLDGSIVPST